MVVKYLLIALVSMVPIVELRGAIPIAEGLGLDIFIYYPVAIIGNMLPVPFIYLFARKFLEWGKDKKLIGKFFTWCLEKGEKGGEKLKETAGNKGLFFALLLFVGVPLPGTGAWTGTLAASFLKIDFKTSILAVTLGVLLAGIIMSLGSKFVAVLGWTGLLAIIAVIAIIIIASIMIRKRKN
ncbi:MAG: small multi-drug export protein [Clostridia bacterium]|nr:small multi-drug export protein [Clostridia bacterium]